MARVALISDIHSNIEALDNVLRDIEQQGVKNICCLGDLIGYGPNPREIIKAARKWDFVLRGNHEDALLYIAMDFSNDAADAIDWTRSELNSENYPKEENHVIWNYIGDLPDIREEGDIMYVHASPRNHTKEYVRARDVVEKGKMTEIFSMIKRLCFYGHTHEPGVFTEDMKFYTPKALMSRAKLIEGKKYMINVGSVGQPRDRDPRACYLVFDKDTNIIEYRRVEYDYRKTMEKIRAIKEIPVKFAERLSVGK